MKYSKYLATAMLVCLGALTLQQVAKADLTVAEIVKQFNDLDGTNKGTYFTFSSNSIGEHQLTATNSGFTSFLGAYSVNSPTTRGSNYFNTFCVELDEKVYSGQSYYGKLSYMSDGTTQSTMGHTLSLGGAFLYQQFATGVLQGYFSSRSSAMEVQLQNAIHFLTNPSQGEANTNWTSGNVFLNYLLTVNDSQQYWKEAYNLNQSYTDLRLGDFSEYAVFVLNMGGNQDQLYVAKVSRPGTDTPEPATMLLWLTGGLSALGFGYAKKRRKMASLA